MTARQLQILRAELRALRQARRLASVLRRDSQEAADRAVRLEGLVYRSIRLLMQHGPRGAGRGRP